MDDGTAAHDPLHTRNAGDSWWSTTNLSEAFPGVLTPLDWSVIGPAVERGTRGALVAIGALAPADADAPDDVGKRAFGVFHGRIASRIDFFHRLGALMPGTSPDAVVSQIFGTVPEGLCSELSRDRYLFIAARFPVTFVRAPRQTRAMRTATRRWWEGEIMAMGGRDLPAARRSFSAAVRRLTENLTTDGILLLAGAQPIYDQLTRLAEAAGLDPSVLMRGAGSHEETQVVADVWEASRGRLPLPILLERHGFHGPNEGVLSGHPWREDSQPLEDLITAFGDLPDDADPRLVDARGQDARHRAERELLASLSGSRRTTAQIVLRLARVYLPLRGKAARTQAIDVARAAARRIGVHLEQKGMIEDCDDVMLLTVTELIGPAGHQLPELVAARRDQLDGHRRSGIPGLWQGQPPVMTSSERLLRGGAQELSELHGVGVSSGTVEGPIRVVHDPSQLGGLVHGEILVARTTDPSWAALMFISGGLVADIGGLLSHAAILARELGIPCVMGTQNATTVLRTGDRCRVDGSAGTIRLLSRP